MNEQDLEMRYLRPLSFRNKYTFVGHQKRSKTENSQNSNMPSEQSYNVNMK